MKKLCRTLVFMLIATVVLVGPIADRPSDARATSRGGERRQDNRWTGVWDTSYGRMELSQTGNRVVGTYEPNTGRISGTAQDRSLTLQWSITDESGTESSGIGSFELAESLDNFSGWWSYEEGGKQNNWSGVKSGDREVSGTIAGVDYCLWRGSWLADQGTITMSQDIESNEVQGQFVRSSDRGTFVGTAEGWTLTFEWETDEESGVGEFEMSNDLASFVGWLEPAGGESEDWEGRFMPSEMREGAAADSGKPGKLAEERN